MVCYGKRYYLMGKNYIFLYRNRLKLNNRESIAKYNEIK